MSFVGKYSLPKSFHHLSRSKTDSIFQIDRPGLHYWVSAPAGFGKTTMVSDRITRANTAYSWFRIDPSNIDIQNFFDSIRSAVSYWHSTDEQWFPKYDSIHHKNLDDYICSLVDRWISQIDEPRIIVFDNIHLVQNQSWFTTFLNYFIQQYGEYIEGNIVLISREQPSACHTKIVALPEFSILTYEQLIFTPDDISELAIMLGYSIDKDKKIEIFELSKGWAAAVYLLLCQNTQLDKFEKNDYTPGSYNLFSFFFDSIYSSFSESDKRTIHIASLMPDICLETLCSILDDNIAPHFITDLYIKNNFTYKNKNNEIGSDKYDFEFHPLFKEYLIEKLRNNCENENNYSLIKKLSSHYLSKSEYSIAGDIYVHMQLKEDLYELIYTHGYRILRTGLPSLVKHFISHLMKQTHIDSLRITTLKYGIEIYSGKEINLESLYSLMKRSSEIDDHETMCICYCLIQRYCAWFWSHLELGQKSTEFIIKKTKNFNTIENSDIQYNCISSALLSECFNPVNQKHYHGIIDEGEKISEKMNTEDCVELLESLYFIYMVKDVSYRKMRNIALRLENILEENISTKHELNIITVLAFSYPHNGRLDKTRALLKRIELFFIHNSGAPIQPYVRNLGDQLSLYQGDAQSVINNIDNRKRHINSEITMQKAYEHYTLCWAHSELKQFDKANDHAEIVENCLDIGFTQTTMVYCSSILIFSYARQKQFDKAEKELLRLTKLTLNNKGEANLMKKIVVAYYDLKQDNTEDIHIKIKDLFSQLSSEGVFLTSATPRYVMQTLIEFALQRKIEENYCKKSINVLNLKPSRNAIKNNFWPHSIVITYGNELSIHIDNKELKFGKKTPKKQLELLQLLLNSNNHSLNATEVCEKIWPGIDFEFSYRSLISTIKRLREILTHDSIVFKNKTVKINRDTVKVKKTTP